MPGNQDFEHNVSGSEFQDRRHVLLGGSQVVAACTPWCLPLEIDDISGERESRQETTGCGGDCFIYSKTAASKHVLVCIPGKVHRETMRLSFQSHVPILFKERLRFLQFHFSQLSLRPLLGNRKSFPSQSLTRAFLQSLYIRGSKINSLPLILIAYFPASTQD